MNDIALSTSREIARAAMRFEFDPIILAKQVERSEVEIAIESFRRVLTPAKEIHRDQIKDDQRELANMIGKIGNRIRPDFNDQQAKKWAAEIVDALSDQPIRVAMAAAAEAKHHPFRFPGEVHAVILEYCHPHKRAYNRAVSNLEKLISEIDNPTPEKPDRSDEPHEEVPIEQLSARTRQSFINVGILIESDDGELRYRSDEEWEARQQAIRNERSIARARG